jgi:phospholipid/cholesterol/gamma-HCH transport system substrate-binding protein
MKRLVAIALLLVAVPLVLVFGTGAGDGGGGSNYKVRAIFDFVRAVPGEDVKVAGAKVGKIDSLQVTPDNKAAVVLAINKAGFSPFHANAHCTIRPQSLIGETFADCQPGTSSAPVLPTIQKGDGKGQHLLGVDHTSSPVDIDEINDIMREPTRERLAILINEFGTGLAGRGKDLGAAIHRANPALRDTDKVLALLASQNRTLADLAKNSDQVLQPLAARRRQVADFIVQANKTAQATAERRNDISAGIQRFPAFLRQLKPTLDDLSSLSDQMTPVITDLGRAAPGLNRFVEELGPFSKASIPAIKSLGAAADVGTPALVAARPITSDLRQLATNADPVSKNLDALTKSLAATGGINHLMDFLFFQMQAINGFDSIGHYLRAGLILNTCTTYATAPIPNCSSNFDNASAAAAGATAGGSGDPTLQKTSEAIRKALGHSGTGGAATTTTTTTAKQPAGKQPSLFQRFLQLANPNTTRQRNAALNKIRTGAGGDGSPALGQADPALNYLLGP